MKKLGSQNFFKNGNMGSQKQEPDNGCSKFFVQ